MFKKGKNHPNWKGNNVGYAALHEWVISRFPKTKLCNNCKQNPPKDLSNKGIYNRNLKNWEWLCRSCHLKKDGRNHKGEKNSQHKLTYKQVNQIRTEYKPKRGQFTELGKKYKVSYWTISMIIKKKTWL